MSIQEVGIVDYGAGNIASVANMLAHVGGTPRVLSDPAHIKEKSKIVLPGVGSFDHGMRALKSSGWAAVLSEAVKKRSVKVVGICLGMQLMCNQSDEGSELGLGWIDAVVRKFDSRNMDGRKIPHMGWNKVEVKKENPLVSNDPEEIDRFYFVHSYYVDCLNKEDVLLTTNYGHPFVSSFYRDNVWGFQFHPEKSHRFGMEIFKRFVELK